jgi:hypothetical protein
MSADRIYDVGSAFGITVGITVTGNYGDSALNWGKKGDASLFGQKRGRFPFLITLFKEQKGVKKGRFPFFDSDYRAS